MQVLTSQLRKYDEMHKIIANRMCSKRIANELSGKDNDIGYEDVAYLFTTTRISSDRSVL
jgi:hypothetical protein